MLVFAQLQKKLSGIMNRTLDGVEAIFNNKLHLRPGPTTMLPVTSERLYRCIEHATKLADLLAATERLTAHKKTDAHELERETLHMQTVPSVNDRELLEFADIMGDIGKCVMEQCHKLVQNRE